MTGRFLRPSLQSWLLAASLCFALPTAPALRAQQPAPTHESASGEAASPAQQ